MLKIILFEIFNDIIIGHLTTRVCVIFDVVSYFTGKWVIIFIKMQSHHSHFQIILQA